MRLEANRSFREQRLLLGKRGGHNLRFCLRLISFFHHHALPAANDPKPARIATPQPPVAASLAYVCLCAVGQLEEARPRRRRGSIFKDRKEVDHVFDGLRKSPSSIRKLLVCLAAHETESRWWTTAVNVKLLLPPWQSPGDFL
jgi:hypothetical protein